MGFPEPLFLPKAGKKGQDSFTLSRGSQSGVPGQQLQLGARELEIMGFEQAPQVVLMCAQFANHLTRAPQLFSVCVVRGIQCGIVCYHSSPTSLLCPGAVPSFLFICHMTARSPSSFLLLIPPPQGPVLQAPPPAARPSVVASGLGRLLLSLSLASTPDDSGSNPLVPQ